MLTQGKTLNRAEAIKTLKPFLDYVLSINESKSFYASIPILRELTCMAVNAARSEMGPVRKRLNRLYHRLCRLQEELGRLDLKKAKPDVSLGSAPGIVSGSAIEDFIFSQIDFSRYREISENYFTTLLA
jgi:hypothetical protein